MPTCYRVRKPMKVGLDIRQPGELIPEAYTWRVAPHLEHSMFMEETEASDDEFQAALTYCDRDTLLKLRDRFGDLVAVPDEDPEPEPEVLRDVPDDAEPYEALPEEDTLIGSVPEPDHYARAFLESLDLTDLRALAKQHGLDTIKKAEIIDALSQEE
jgi:hypothetical protein